MPFCRHARELMDFDVILEVLEYVFLRTMSVRLAACHLLFGPEPSESFFFVEKFDLGIVIRLDFLPCSSTMNVLFLKP